MAEPTIWVIIPAYNEGRVLADVIGELLDGRIKPKIKRQNAKEADSPFTFSWAVADSVPSCQRRTFRQGRPCERA